MLDRNIAHAMAQLSDPIVMIGAEMKLVYANLAARKLTADQPARLLQAPAMRAAHAQMRAGTVTLPLKLSIELDSAPAGLPGTLFDWKAAGGFILVIRSDSPAPVAAPVLAKQAVASIPRLLRTVLVDELDRYLANFEGTFAASAEAHEGESLGASARAFRRSLTALTQLEQTPDQSTLESIRAARVASEAWAHLATLAHARGVSATLQGDEIQSLTVPNSIELAWAVTESLAYLVRRVPEGDRARPWRIEVRAFRSGTDVVIAIDSVGRIALQEQGISLPTGPGGEASRLPAGAGEGLPLVRAILAAAGGRFEMLAEDQSVARLLLRYPAP